MSWISELCVMYDNIVGSEELGNIPPLPISHSIQNAHVEIRLEKDGSFNSALPLPKEDSKTIIPVTEDSASRGAGIVPHVLHDKLYYLAKDLSSYIGDEKQKKYYDAYMEQLKNWAENDDCPYEVKAVYEYEKNGTIVSDLISSGILALDEKKTLQWNGDKKNKPSKSSDTFVRFSVYNGKGFTKCNKNYALFESYTKFYSDSKKDRKICYVTGEIQPYTEKHPSRIRGNGDMAKLISANDTSGFTFRGRFKESSDAVCVGYETSQKAHNALRWLVSNYGWKIGDETIVAWSMQGNKYPSLNSDSFDLINQSFCDDEAEEAKDIIEGAKIADIRKAVDGCKTRCFNKNGQLDNVIIMGMESATTGRLSVTMYHKILGSRFLDNIEKWHTECAWHHFYKNVQEGEKKKVSFTGAPSPDDIVQAAYGINVGDKIKKSAIKRIVEFIATGNSGIFPTELMRRIVKRVSNPASMEVWELNKNTSIACAMVRMYRKAIKKEDYLMDLNVNDKLQKERNFMFGRVLAYMEEIENDAIYQQSGKDGDKRVPNAVKLRSIFTQRPADTMLVLNNKLTPYIQRTYCSYGGKKFRELQDIIAEMTMLGFLNDDRKTNNASLDERYIMGYSCQMNEFRARKTKKED